MTKLVKPETEEMRRHREMVDRVTKYVIPVGRNHDALVDSDVFRWAQYYRWWLQTNSTTDIGYAVREIRLSNGKRRVIRMHREILGLVHGDGTMVDHINRNGLDNRRDNLRIADKRVNALNSKVRSDSLSGVTGVAPNRSKWRAYTYKDGKQIQLGTYSTIEEAANVRQSHS